LNRGFLLIESNEPKHQLNNYCSVTLTWLNRWSRERNSYKSYTLHFSFMWYIYIL